LNVPQDNRNVPALPTDERRKQVIEFNLESDEPIPMCPMRKDGLGADEVCDACQ